MNFTKFFDLSQPLYHNCPGWPTYKMTETSYEAIYPNDLFTAERIDLNVHTGTHLDAPFHFSPSGITIDQMPLERFQGVARLIDLKAQLSPAQGITAELLEPFDSLIKAEDIAILYTGWGQKRDHTLEYYHDWPYLSASGAEWFKRKKVKGVGIDGMSMGGWYEGTGRPCHEILLPENIWFVEELIIPDELLNYPEFYFCAFPLKLKGFSGSPTRAVAMV